MGWGYTPPGGGGGGGGGAIPEGGITMMAAFQRMADGALTASNGDGPEDPSSFTDVSSFSGGTSGLLAIRDGQLRIDPSLATGEADCFGVVIQGDPIYATVDGSYYTDGVRMVFGFGPIAGPPSPLPSDFVQTYSGFMMTDSTGAGWRLEIRGYDASDGNPSSRIVLAPTVAYVPDFNNPLYDSTEMTGNYTAGIYWMDHNADGTWALWKVGTKLAEGDGLFDQNLTTLLALVGGQRDLSFTSDTPVADFYVPMTGWATVQPGIPLYTFGPR